MIVLEAPCNGQVHIAKLGTVAFVKYEDNVFFIDIVPLILSDEPIQLLYGGDNYPIFVRIAPFVPIFKLPLQNPRRRVAVCRALFEAVVFFHRLVIKVFAVDDKQHLINIRQGGSQLRRFETGQGLA